MHFSIAYALGVFASASPFLAIFSILVYYQLRRVVWRRRKRLGKLKLGFCPSSFALGMAFLFIQVCYRPSVAHVLETKQDEVTDEDDEGDPDTPKMQLNRQLRKIRRGEPIHGLVLRF